jgi:glycosyltransferase involved in cell wall biosynthesis
MDRESMRVALIAHSDSPWAPPYSRYLRDRGHPVIVISFHPRQIPGIEVEYVGVGRADGSLPKTVYLRHLPRVRQVLRRWRPDVVLATYYRSNGLIGALTKSSALVVSSRGTDQTWGLPGCLNRRLTRWIGDRAELVHASSPELAESLTRSGIEPEKIAVIPLGVDSQEFTPRQGARQPGPARILCTRKHYAVYDNNTIVRALSILRQEGLPFECHFAGTGPTLGATRRLAEDLGLSPGVRFLGEVEPTEVRELLHWADVYVSAARSDGAPSSLFEAMSCGVFPVVSDIRANRDWVVPGRTGHLCGVGRAIEWADGIRFAWDNPGLRAAAAAANRSLIEKHCDRATGLGKIEDLLHRALALHRRHKDS